MDDPAYLAARPGDEDPGGLGLDEDPDDAPPPEVNEGELAAEADRIAGDLAREAAVLAGAGLTAAVAADAASAAGRRGPGMPGSVQSVPGVYASRASGFASGKPLDTAPGWAEASGNAGLAGRELPPAQVLTADQRVTAWAKELRKAGLEGGMDALRARAYLDILLGMDSRPLDTKPDGSREPQAPAPPPAPGGPLAGMIPPGFAGHVSLTIPEATVTGRADRPGELGGIGPVDPDLARDLAVAAARNPRSTWCVTVTDRDGHAVGHGCARPARRRKPDGPDPPGAARFTFTPAGPPGPAGGYGTWRFTAGPQDMLIEIGPLPAGECDHRWQARGHDPGVMLRHLTEVRNARCTGPGCRRPAVRCDFEHNVPYEAGGRTCLCNGGPKCRFDHRMKQDPRWKADQLPGGYVRWTAPSGRQYVTEPTRYPI